MTDLRPAPSRVDPGPFREIVGHAHVHTDDATRLRRGSGKSTPDLLRQRAGEVSHAPDVVVCPSTHDEVQALLTFCSSARLAVVPHGGGTSVVGGLSPQADRFAGVVAIDLWRLNSLVDLDPISRTATLSAGMRAPHAETLLNEHGFTLGHFPQSFEHATIGGFAATRSSGQASAGYGRFDTMVVALTVATPAGPLSLGRAPASAAGPDLRQLFLGSEGTLGIITSVTVRLRPLPPQTAYHGWSFPSFDDGLEAVRAMAQDGPLPTVLRLSDELESTLQYSIDGALLIVGTSQPTPTATLFDPEISDSRPLGATPLGLETSGSQPPNATPVGLETSSSQPSDATSLGLAISGSQPSDATPLGLKLSSSQPSDATPLSRETSSSQPPNATSLGPKLSSSQPPGATPLGAETVTSQHLHGATPLGQEIGEKWLRGRYSGPYLRDALLDAGAFVETLETAAFWSRLPQLYRAVRDAFGSAFLVLCHVSHVYETGASLYFTAVGPMITTAQWSEVKAAASEAILANGGTITHHHGVGTDHRDWYVREVGELAIDTLRAAKHRLDPHGILNPGVLIPLP